jgi:hypothetical protein
MLATRRQNSIRFPASDDPQTHMLAQHTLHHSIIPRNGGNMTLAATETIDQVYLTRDRGTLKLVVVATEDLSAEGPAVEQLRLKLAHYHDALRSGRFDEMFLQYAALPKTIQISHFTALGAPAEEVLTRCAQELGPDRLRLVSEALSYNPLRILLRVIRGRLTHEWTA